MHRVTQGGDAAVDLAVGNASRTYGEVIASRALIPMRSPDSDDAIEHALREAMLPPRAEVADRFLFWLPDVIEPYRSKSAPVDEAHRRPDPEGSLAGT